MSVSTGATNVYHNEGSWRTNVITARLHFQPIPKTLINAIIVDNIYACTDVQNWNMSSPVLFYFVTIIWQKNNDNSWFRKALLVHVSTLHIGKYISGYNTVDLRSRHDTFVRHISFLYQYSPVLTEPGTISLMHTKILVEIFPGSTRMTRPNNYDAALPTQGSWLLILESAWINKICMHCCRWSKMRLALDFITYF